MAPHRGIEFLGTLLAACPSASYHVLKSDIWLAFHFNVLSDVALMCYLIVLLNENWSQLGKFIPYCIVRSG
jgi:hypothetical protein